MEKRPSRKRSSSPARKRTASRKDDAESETEEDVSGSEEGKNKDGDGPDEGKTGSGEEKKEKNREPADSSSEESGEEKDASGKEEEPADSDDARPASHKGSTGKKLLFLFISLAVFGAAIYGGLYLKSGPQSHMGAAGEGQEGHDPLFVETLTVKASDTYESRRVYSGVIRAKKLLDLSFQASGRVDTILPETGDLVEEGVELAYFDNSGLEDTREELDEKRLDTQDELDDLLDQGIARTNERIKGLDSAIDDLEQKIDEIDDAIESRTLTAPFDGVIALKHVTEGAVVSPSVPVLRIMQEDNLEAWIAVPVSLISQLEKGKDYELTVGDKIYEAKIDTILPEVDSRTRTRTVVFTLSEEDAREVATGASVELVLRQEIQSDGFWLPIKAMTREVRGLWSVYLVEENEEGEEKIARAYLEVIYLEGERAWVRGTLEEGDKVVLGDGDRVVADGILRIVPGQRVTTTRENKDTGPEEGEGDNKSGKEAELPKAETNEENSDP